jgi:hypothetical protein
MSPVGEKQAKLANALIKSDQRGKLIWKPYSEDEGCVYTEVGGKMIYLDEYHNNGTDSVKVEIYFNGVLADSFIDDDLPSSGVRPLTNDNWYTALTWLLESARRKSSGADEVLDSLLKDLDEQ